MNKAIFLDRDGVLNEDPGFLHRIEDLKFYPGVIDALIEFSQTDYIIVIVTNQPGIGRGYYTEKEYLAFEKEYLYELDRLSDGKIRIDKVYYCPHHPTAGIGKYKIVCECRKPASGMLLNAQKEFNIDFSLSYMIGDKRSDIQAGKTVGCKTIR
jgi:D-glycero-D-manno-heptose 1,7-bisphosphate phosphatase